MQDELTPFYPRSPYGVTSFLLTQTVTTRKFWLARLIGNSIQPRVSVEGHEFITKRFLHSFQRSLGPRDTVKLGNINAKATGFAREYVVGMHLMLQQPKATTTFWLLE